MHSLQKIYLLIFSVTIFVSFGFQNEDLINYAQKEQYAKFRLKKYCLKKDLWVWKYKGDIGNDFPYSHSYRLISSAFVYNEDKYARQTVKKDTALVFTDIWDLDEKGGELSFFAEMLDGIERDSYVNVDLLISGLTSWWNFDPKLNDEMIGECIEGSL